MFTELTDFTLATQFLYAVAVPYFFALMGWEYFWIKFRKDRAGHSTSPFSGYTGYEKTDSACSIAMGALKLVTMAAAGLYIIPIMYWLYDHRLFTLPFDSLWFLPLLIVVQDFCYYWYHRCAHRSSFLWAEHSNHHTSETYNLSTALRQSLLGPFYAFVFFTPMALFGFEPLTIVFAQAFNLLYQYWIHTETFEVKGWAEKVLNCPQHHRLHHAKNKVYHDCNYAGIFILWDRLFGSYRDYTNEIPVYGTVTPVLTKNPIKQGFAGWVMLIRKVKATPGLNDKLKRLVMPPDWEPEAASGQPSPPLR
ncbi:MAG: sterol desaturase family protein [Limnobacter sp.]|nr:sterol desaturase family protein [Limnobacter sp.]